MKLSVRSLLRGALGFAALAAVALAYLNLPLEWRRYKDIEFGNRLIAGIEQYRQTHHRLPENQDEAALKQIGFKKNQLGWQPDYRKLNDSDFSIIYQEGYDAPYLGWDSAGRTWHLQHPNEGSK